jgi:hypothetical protein
MIKCFIYGNFGPESFLTRIFTSQWGRCWISIYLKKIYSLRLIQFNKQQINIDYPNDIAELQA